MASEVSIAKQALLNLSDRFDLDTLKDNTPEAEAIALVFDDTRDAVLRKHPWKFAKTYWSPEAISGTPPANWTYMYPYPDHILKVVKIESPFGRDAVPLKFDVARSSTGQKVILTDVEAPEFQGTERIVDPYDFDPLFIKALAFQLAADVAMTLTGDRSLRNEMQGDANASIESAKADDANEGVGEELDRDPDWITARI